MAMLALPWLSLVACGKTLRCATKKVKSRFSLLANSGEARGGAGGLSGSASGLSTRGFVSLFSHNASVGCDKLHVL